MQLQLKAGRQFSSHRGSKMNIAKHSLGLGGRDQNKLRVMLLDFKVPSTGGEGRQKENFRSAEESPEFSCMR